MLGLLLAAGLAPAGELRALRLTTTERVHFHWDQGDGAARKTAHLVVTPADGGGGRLVYVVRFRDGRDDARARREVDLSPADMARLRERVEAARLRDLDGEAIGHLMETVPRFELVLEDTDGLVRVRGAGFGDHAATVGALFEALVGLVRRGPPPPADPEAGAVGDLRLTLRRTSALLRRGEGDEADTYRLGKRTAYVVAGQRLRVRVAFEDSDGDVARSERAVRLSAAERAELATRLAAADVPGLVGVETSNLLHDTPVYELAQARPGAAPAVVRGEGFGRHEAALKPLVDLLVYLGRRGPDLEVAPARERDAEDEGPGLAGAIGPLGE